MSKQVWVAGPVGPAVHRKSVKPTGGACDELQWEPCTRDDAVDMLGFLVERWTRGLADKANPDLVERWRQMVDAQMAELEAWPVEGGR